MALILRPIKTLGNREYALEKAANPNEPIKSAEVDADLDTVYALVNGNIDTTNISSTANIVGGQIAPNAGINGSQLSSFAGITGQQLNAGAGIRQIVTQATTTANNIVTETTILTLNITPHGGSVFLFGWWDAQFTCQNASGSAAGTLTLRLKRDGTTIQTMQPNIGWSTSGTPNPNSILFPVPPPIFIETPTAVAHVYTLTATTPGANFLFSCTNAGIYFAVEFA